MGHGEITVMLREWSSGNRTNEDTLFHLIYPQLRVIAGMLFRRERPENMLQPTGVVNELFLRLLTQKQLAFNDREHFYNFAARVMRRVLIDQARSEKRQKRDGGVMVPLDDETAWADCSVEDVIDFDDALRELEALDERKCKMVELRFLLGLTADETATLMRVSKASVDRDLRFVRCWLKNRLQGVAQ